MSRKFSTLFIVAIVISVTFLFSAIFPNKVYADLDNNSTSFPPCDIKIGKTNVTPNGGETVRATRVEGNIKIFDITVCSPDIFNQQNGDQDSTPNYCIANGRQVVASIYRGGLFGWEPIDLTANSSGCYTGSISMKDGDGWKEGGELDIELDGGSGVCGKNMPICHRVSPVLNRSIIEDNEEACNELIDSFKNCSFLSALPKKIIHKDVLTLSGTLPAINTAECNGEAFGTPKFTITHKKTQPLSEALVFGQSFTHDFTASEVGQHVLSIKAEKAINTGTQIIVTEVAECKIGFNVCGEGISGCESNVGTPLEPASANFELCKQVGESQHAACIACTGTDEKKVEGIWTAVGCIKTEPKSIIEAVVRIGIGIGGGIALLMTLVGGFLITTSQGEPKRLQEGKEMVTSAVIGIIFMLFSVVILQFIGVTILRLPGFGTA